MESGGDCGMGTDEEYLEYEDDETPTIPAREAFRRFWPLTQGLRRWLVLVWVCTVIAALAETESILLFSDLTDRALAKGSLSAFWSPAVKWLGVAIGGAFVAYVGNSIAAWST